jgi:hypothetical protein
VTDSLKQPLHQNELQSHISTMLILTITSSILFLCQTVSAGGGVNIGLVYDEICAGNGDLCVDIGADVCCYSEEHGRLFSSALAVPSYEAAPPIIFKP